MSLISISDFEDLKIHPLANLTPGMGGMDFEALKLNLREKGQREPIVLWGGKVLDGRHRLKALKELGAESIEAKVYSKNELTHEEAKALVISYEARRHQTSAQKAIYAWKLWKSALGEKTQESICKEVGVSRSQFSRVVALHKLVGETVIDELYNGSKLRIEKERKVQFTNSLAVILTYYEQKLENDLVRGDELPRNYELTHEQLRVVNETAENIELGFSEGMKKVLCGRLRGG